MAANPDDWTKELEADLAALAADMWSTQQRSPKKASGSMAATNRLLGGG